MRNADANGNGGPSPGHSAACITLASLFDRPLWCGWDKQPQRNGGKPTKVPFDPKTNRRVDVQNYKAQNFGSRAEAHSWAMLKSERVASAERGIGLVLTPLDDEWELCGIDVDSVRNISTGEIEDDRAKTVLDRIHSHTEVSPSKTGVKIFGICRIKGRAAARLVNRKFKESATGGHERGIELFLGYFTVTNDQFGPDTVLREIPIEALKWLAEEHGPTFQGRKTKAREKAKRARTDALFWSPAPQARVQSALDAIPNDGPRENCLPYDGEDSLLQVMMSVHWTGWPCAYDMAHAFSRRSERHNQSDFDNKWKSFKDEYEKPVTLATLFWIAAKYGWVDPSARQRLPVPRANAERLPVMQLLDAVLSTGAPNPPMRDLEGFPVEVRVRKPMGLHALTSETVNADDGGSSRLPPPALPLLSRHDTFTLAFLVEQHAEFYKDLDDGSEVPVALPSIFIKHYIHYGAYSTLPKVSAVTTLPMVLANGELVGENGLDRKLCVFFSIDETLVEKLPKGEISDLAIEKAMRFLVEEWLVDVSTSFAGKCVLVSMAISMIERLLSTRPLYSVTAGRRGGGKTTAVQMIASAVIGKEVPAAAWSRDPEERRKAIFAAMREGVPIIAWDNIPRGALISDPTIEKICTSPSLYDRVLGESKNEDAPADAVMIFTGNNITTKGDLASRTLMVRIDVDRPDPENRQFSHPNPIGWTLAQRGEILAALYTILLGNPRFKPYADERGPAKTRYKEWWHLVGAPVEYAAGLLQQQFDFKEQFVLTEDEDDETETNAQALCILREKFGSQKFSSTQVLQFVNSIDDPDPNQNELRALIEKDQRGGRTMTVSTIAAWLRARTDAPIYVGTDILTLRREKKSKLKGKAKHFWVQKPGEEEP
jgi:Primase C terminal 2 (PriCT-2)